LSWQVFFNAWRKLFGRQKKKRGRNSLHIKIYKKKWHCLWSFLFRQEVKKKTKLLAVLGE